MAARAYCFLNDALAHLFLLLAAIHLKEYII